jgi:hypothetical protein
MRRMYIRVTQGKNDPSRQDEGIAIIRELGIPSMREAAGIGNAWWGVNRETGQVVVVSTWDTLEHASQTIASPELLARIEALGTEGLGVTIYEVTDQI